MKLTHIKQNYCRYKNGALQYSRSRFKVIQGHRNWYQYEISFLPLWHVPIFYHFVCKLSNPMPSYMAYRRCPSLQLPVFFCVCLSVYLCFPDLCSLSAISFYVQNLRWPANWLDVID